jgi:hypothetical protein
MSRRSQLTTLVQKYLGVRAKDERTITSLFNLIDGNYRTNPFMFQTEWKIIKRAYRANANSNSQRVSLQ